MQPIFTNDAVILGVLLSVLAFVFTTSNSDHKFWKRFYGVVPPILLCYFIPALLHYPFGLIMPEWFDAGIIGFASQLGIDIPTGASFETIKKILEEANVKSEDFAPFVHKSKLYFVASRYLLPASLVLLCLNIDFKGIMNLGGKAIIMFFTATIGIIIGGPIALLLVMNVFPDLIAASPEQLWRGLSTVAGSWIGGGANQLAMKEIFEVSDVIFTSMIVVDVVMANIWMGFLLYGANISERVDNWLGADTSAIEALKNRVESYSQDIARIPSTRDLFVLIGVAFGGVALAHLAADTIVPQMSKIQQTLIDLRLNSLLSGFFWMVVVATTVGLVLSFTKARQLEGVGASRWGSVFIYILVATIGMKMNLQEILSNLGLFAVGFVWMLIHVITLLIMAKLIKAPFFFVAVGSQANVGGAASAPVVASAFSPALAPVGVLMAVLGYAIGTYGAIFCAYLMQIVAT